MTTLQLVEVSTGRVLDTITLDGAALRYDTGAAQSLVETEQARRGSNAAAFESLDGWSNGYLRISRAAS